MSLALRAFRFEMLRCGYLLESDRKEMLALIKQHVEARPYEETVIVASLARRMNLNVNGLVDLLRCLEKCPVPTVCQVPHDDDFSPSARTLLQHEIAQRVAMGRYDPLEAARSWGGRGVTFMDAVENYVLASEWGACEPRHRIFESVMLSIGEGFTLMTWRPF